MIDLRELFLGLALPGPGHLVDQFKHRLLKEGAKIEEVPGAKYFAVCMHGPAVVVLAHESTGHGFWGIRRDIVERCLRAEEKSAPGDFTWGAVLLDDSFARGFWIHGSHVRELSDSFSKANEQYLYHKRILENSEGKHGYFIGIHDFFDKGGFSPEPYRVEV